MRHCRVPQVCTCGGGLGLAWVGLAASWATGRPEGLSCTVHYSEQWHAHAHSRTGSRSLAPGTSSSRSSTYLISSVARMAIHKVASQCGKTARFSRLSFHQVRSTLVTRWVNPNRSKPFELKARRVTNKRLTEQTNKRDFADMSGQYSEYFLRSTQYRIVLSTVSSVRRLSGEKSCRRLEL